MGLLLIATVSALGACGGSDEVVGPDGAPSEASDFAKEWPTPNGDLANRRVATSEIDSGNVDDLGVAWTVPIKGGGTFGNYASTPIIADGVVYTQDLTSNVKAIDLETGDVMWSKDYDAPSRRPERPHHRLRQGLRRYLRLRVRARCRHRRRGLALREADQERKRGHRHGAGGLRRDAVRLDRPRQRHVVLQGQRRRRAVGAGRRDRRDEVDVLDRAREPLGHSTRTSTPAAASGTRRRSTTRATMYIDIANPAPLPGTDKFPWGSSRPGPEPAHEHARQAEPRGRQGDLEEPGPPARRLRLGPAAAADPGRRRRPATLVLAAGKMGYVYAIDARRRQARLEDARRQAQRPRRRQRARARGQVRPAAEAPADRAARHPRRRRDADGRRRTASSTRRSSTSRRSSRRRQSYDAQTSPRARARWWRSTSPTAR